MKSRIEAFKFIQDYIFNTAPGVQSIKMASQICDFIFEQEKEKEKGDKEMKVKEVSVGKNATNPSGRSIGYHNIRMTADVQEGENPILVAQRLEEMIEFALDPRRLAAAKEILNDPDNFTGKQVKDAQEFVAKAKEFGL